MTMAASLDNNNAVPQAPYVGRAWRRVMRHKFGMIGLAILASYIIVAVFAPLLTPFNPDAVNLRDVMKWPSAIHWFGTDQFGRDVLSRTIYGARTSLLLGFCVVGIATVAGLILGVLAGYYRGLVEQGTIFLTDVLMTLPSIITALAVITVLGSGLVSTIVAVAIASVPRLIRISRGAVLQVSGLEFIESARALGASDATIVLRHVLPNSMSPVIVQASLLMAESVLVAAGLGFLGLGVAPPLPEWGQMLAEGRGYLRVAPFISIFPGLAIATLVLGLNLLGDGLRDTLDVRLR
jgi:peptide/nickel transport system permease protein